MCLRNLGHSSIRGCSHSYGLTFLIFPFLLLLLLTVIFIIFFSENIQVDSLSIQGNLSVNHSKVVILTSLTVNGSFSLLSGSALSLAASSSVEIKGIFSISLFFFLLFFFTVSLVP